MALANLGLLTGSTVAITGGTAQAFAPDNQVVPNGIHVVDTSVTDYRVRPYITAKAKSPVKLPDGKWTKDFRSVIMVNPFIDSKGDTQYDYIEVRRALHPESTWGAESRKKGAQLCADTDLDTFYTIGSFL